MGEIEARIEEFPLNGKMLSVDVQFRFHWEAFVRGTWEYPDEGGYPEDVEAIEVAGASDEWGPFTKEAAATLLPAVQEWLVGQSEAAQAFVMWLDEYIADQVCEDYYDYID